MLNKALMIGHVGTDPELKYTPNGTATASFRLAVSRGYTTADGEKRTDTEWFTVSTWGKQAESCNQYLSKGKKIHVEGRLKSNSWTAQDGSTRFSNELVASQVLFLDPADHKNEDDKVGAAASSGDSGPWMV